MIETMFYGVLAWEIKIGLHIKNRLLFAVTDKAKKQIAWYLYSEIMPFGWQSGYDMAMISDEKQLKAMGFDARVFGTVQMAGLPYQSRLAFDKFAKVPGKGTGTEAQLTFGDDKDDIAVVIGLFVGSNVEVPTFNLTKIADRRTPTLRDKRNALMPRAGKVWLFAVEPYSYGALMRDNGLTPTVSQLDPFSPTW